MPNEQNGRLMLKRPNSLMAFREKVLKIRGGKGTLEGVNLLLNFLLIDWW